MPFVDTLGNRLASATPYGGELDPQMRSSLARAALLNFGTNMLANTTNPDIGSALGQSLSRGIGTFQSGVGDFLQEERARRGEGRQEEYLGLARGQEARSTERHDADMARLAQELQMEENARKFGEVFREHAVKNSDPEFAEIIAQADPLQMAQTGYELLAQGTLSTFEDQILSDYEKLTRQREGERHEATMESMGAQTDLMRTRAAEEPGGRGRDLTPGQRLNALSGEIDRLARAEAATAGDEAAVIAEYRRLITDPQEYARLESIARQRVESMLGGGSPPPAAAEEPAPSSPLGSRVDEMAKASVDSIYESNPRLRQGIDAMRADDLSESEILEAVRRLLR